MSRSSFPELPILGSDPADNSDNDNPLHDRPTVLITGANGNLGKKLRAAWETSYELILFDRDAQGDSAVVEVDLARLDERWTDYFEEVDAVVHLAATPNEFSSWADLVAPNMDALFNVFQASAASGVARLVYASSNHVMGGYREPGFDACPITVDLPPRPGNPYGAAKLMGERLGGCLAQTHGMEFVALRLGWIQQGDNLPQTLPDDWARGLWLSNRDMIRLFRLAVEAPLSRPIVIVNGLSQNPGTRWDLSWTQQMLGFVPEDGESP